MSRIPRVQPGQPLLAEQYNRLADMVEAMMDRLGMDGAGGQGVSAPSLAHFSLVELSEDVIADAKDKDANLLTYDGSLSTDKWPDSTRDLVDSVNDAQSGLHLAGQRAMTFFHPAAGKHMLWPGVAFHLGKVDSAIAAGGSGAVSVWEVSGGSHADSGLNVTAFDWTGAALSAGDVVYVFQHLQTPRRWYAVRASSISEIIRFELNSTLTAGGSATGLKVVWNGSAYATTGSTLTFRDFMGNYTGAAGDQGMAVKFSDRADYEIIVIESVLGMVRLESGGTLNFLKFLLNNFNTSATYTSGRDLLVEFEIVSGKLTAYVRTPGISGHATTGEKVLTISTNVSAYVGPSEECS